MASIAFYNRITKERDAAVAELRAEMKVETGALRAQIKKLQKSNERAAARPGDARSSNQPVNTGNRPASLG